MYNRLDFIQRANAGYIEEQYRRYRLDPTSVPEEWALFFAGFDLAENPSRRPGVEAGPSGVYGLVHTYREFGHLIGEGFGPNRSAFLSSFFALVGTHGLHVALGLVWMAVLAAQIICNPDLSEREIRRLTCLSLFWHFLDIVWICVFSFVYLAGVI